MATCLKFMRWASKPVIPLSRECAGLPMLLPIRPFCSKRQLVRTGASLQFSQAKPNSSLRSFASAAHDSVIFEVGSEEEFREKVIGSSVPVVVDFFADWCGPCKMLAPRIEAKILGRNGEISLAKVNVDSAGDLAIDYGVRAVPTIVAFKNGEEVNRFEGDRGDEHLDEFLDELVNS